MKFFVGYVVEMAMVLAALLVAYLIRAVLPPWMIMWMIVITMGLFEGVTVWRIFKVLPPLDKLNEHDTRAAYVFVAALAFIVIAAFLGSLTYFHGLLYT